MRQITVISKNKQYKTGAKSSRMFINNFYLFYLSVFIFTFFGQKMIRNIQRFNYGTFSKIFENLQ